MLFSVSSLYAGGQGFKKTKIESQSRAENRNSAEPVEKLSAWKIIKMTDWLFLPFVIITAVGLMLISYRGLAEHQEKSRAQTLLQGRIKVSSIRGMVQLVKSSQPNRASRLMYQMISTFDKTKRAEPIGDDINQFLNAERDSFETFNRVNGFLSESAGALGLLGTVWGIFQTFHAGKLDGPTILQGMSISLVTTLVGLIISLMLNMGGTYVFTLFNRQLNLLANRAEELRQALLYLEKKSANDIETENDSELTMRVAEPKFQPPKINRKKKPREHRDVIFAEI